jgi:hypothetical protein
MRVLNKPHRFVNTPRYSSLALSPMKLNFLLSVGVALAISAIAFLGCNSDLTGKKEKAALQHASAAQQVYVAPGKLDDYYAILCGVKSGRLFV